MSIDVLSPVLIYPVIADGPRLRAQFDDVSAMPYTFGSADFGDYLTNRNEAPVVCQVTLGDVFWHLAEAIYHFSCAQFGKAPENVRRPQFYAQAMSFSAYRDLQIVRSYFRSFSDPLSAAYMYEEAHFQMTQYNEYILREPPAPIDYSDTAALKRTEQARFEELLGSEKQKGKRAGRATPFVNVEVLVARLNQYYVNHFEVSDNQNEIERYRVFMVKGLEEREITEKTLDLIDTLVDIEAQHVAFSMIVKIDDENIRETAFLRYANLMLKTGDLYNCQVALIHPKCPTTRARDEALETLYLRYDSEGNTYSAEGILAQIRDREIHDKYEKAGPSGH